MADPRLAVHAASALPAWLWSLDGACILWANPVGVSSVRDDQHLRSRFAKLRSCRSAPAAGGAAREPSAANRRSAARTNARLCRARRPSHLRLLAAEFPDVGSGILVRAAEPAGRGMPLVERLQRLVDGVDMPIAAFLRDGLFVAASDARGRCSAFAVSTEAGLDGCAITRYARAAPRPRSDLAIWCCNVSAAAATSDLSPCWCRVASLHSTSPAALA